MGYEEYTADVGFHGRPGELLVSGTGCRMAAPCQCSYVEHGAPRLTVWFHDDGVQFVYEVSDLLRGKTVHPAGARIVRCVVFALALPPSSVRVCLT